MIYFSLFFFSFFLINCSNDDFEDNVLYFENSSIDSTKTVKIGLSFSKDSIEVGTPVIFNIIAENIYIDSTKFSFDGDTIVDKEFNNFVKTYAYSYSTVGEYNPIVYIYFGGDRYKLTKKISVLPVGFNVKIDTISVDTVDTIVDTYVVDTNLSIGSKPIIAFLGDVDTLFFNAGDDFYDPGAIAFDEEDGEISQVISIVDTVLLNLSSKILYPTTAKITYKVKDSNGNISSRDRVCIISNNRFRMLYNLITDDDTLINKYFDILDTTASLSMKDILIKKNGFYHGESYSKIDSTNITVRVNFKGLKTDTTQTVLNLYNSSKNNMLRIFVVGDTIGVQIEKDDAYPYNNIYFKTLGYTTKLIHLTVTAKKGEVSIYKDKILLLKEPMKNWIHLISVASGYKLNVGADNKDSNIFKGLITKFQIIETYVTQDDIDQLDEL